MEKPTQHHRLIILGSGPAGYTAAIYAARANFQPVLITGMALGGQLMTTTDVDNWPADVMGVQGPDLMTRFQQHAERFDTKIIMDHIHTTQLQQKPLTLIGDLGKLYVRCINHCHRRLCTVSGASFRGEVHGPWRVRLCNL